MPSSSQSGSAPQMSDQYKMVKHIGFVYVLDGCVVNGHNTIVVPSSLHPKIGILINLW
jgi:hypothetical protein